MLRRRLAGLGYLILLIAVLAGIPAALWLFRGNPLPTHVPTLDEITEVLTKPDNGELFLSAVTLAGWIAWALFAFTILMEMAGAIRGVRVPRIAGLSVGQKAAATLVGGALLLLSPATAMAAPGDTAQDPGSTSHSAQQTPGQQQSQPPVVFQQAPGADDPGAGQTAPGPSTGPGAAEPGTTQAPAPQAPSADAPQAQTLPTFKYCIQAGDTLWDLAHVFLGDGSRYHEIVAQNSVITNPDLIYTGDFITMPTHLLGGPDGREYTVQRNDSLYVIAKVFLNDASRMHEIRGVNGPLTSDVIHPGQKLVLPLDAAATPGAGPAAQPKPWQPRTPAAQPEENKPPAAAPAPPPKALPEKIDPNAGPVSTVAPSPPADVKPAAAQEEDQFADVIKIGLAISVAAAAGLVGHLAWRRRKQQHRRRQGERIAMPEGEAALAEEELTATAAELTTQHADTALRQLAEYFRENQLTLPAVRAVTIGENDIEVGFSEPAELPEPWFAYEPSNWAVDPAQIPEGVPETPVSPYPSLVSLGNNSADGRELLLNLEEIGLLGVTGTAEDGLSVLRAMALEFAVSPLADQTHVHLVGFGHEVAAAITTGRITSYEKIDGVLEQIGRHLLEDAEIMARDGVQSVAQARAAYADSELTAPQIVLVNHSLSEHHAAVAAEILRISPRVPFAVVTAGSAGPSPWQLAVAPARPLKVAGEEQPRFAKLMLDGAEVMTLQVTALTAEMYAAVVELIDTTEKPAHKAQPEPVEDVADEPATAPVVVLRKTYDESKTEDISFADDGFAPESRPQLTIAGAPALASEASTGEDAGTGAAVGGATRSGEESDMAGEWEAAEEAVAGRASAVPTTSADPYVPAEVPGFGHIWVSVLGEPMVTPLNPGDPEGREPSLTELAALLATHPEGVSSADINAKMWPRDLKRGYADKSVQARITRRRNEYLTRLRKWMGETESGEWALRKSGDTSGRTPQQFHPEVLCDWTVWQKLVDQHPFHVDTDRLQTALDMVRAQPFTSTDRTAYGWADYLRQDMISAISDVAEELASRYIRGARAPFDLAKARKAAEIGIAVDSVNEGAWRCAIIATHFSGAPDAVELTQGLIDQMLTELDEIEETPDEETQELLGRLADYEHGATYRIGAAS